MLTIYAQRILDAIQRDGFYVRVPSGKQFYLYVLQTIDRSDAVIGGATTPFAEESSATARRVDESAPAPGPAAPGPVPPLPTTNPTFPP